jgi:hypothetical protein
LHYWAVFLPSLVFFVELNARTLKDVFDGRDGAAIAGNFGFSAD